ncbi:MAG TPA: S8 family serine peptidase, partial [Planctomycetota bacterium]|nr:S8 family serine peptidase [Planctomycetota bacterium]
MRAGAAIVRQHGRLHSSTATASPASQTALRSTAGVVGVEEDFLVSASVTPAQATDVTGSTTPPPEGIPYGVYRISGAPGSGMNTGAGVVIAIVDTGIDLTHPDLQPNIIGSYNAINATRSANDDNGHGSHCAGIAAAAHNGVGVIGVAPDAKLLAVKVLDRNGSGTSSDVAEGILWAADNGAQVISMSLGSSSSSSLIQTAVQDAASRNIVICAAAGNDGPAAPGSSDVEYPGAYPECLAISCWTDLDGTPAATGAISPWGDPDESLASFSCTGAEVDFTAPGVQIYSDWKSGGFNTISGTSMSTPHAAGVAALNIKAGKADVRAAMAARCEHVAGTPEQIGAGLIRASAPLPPTVTISAPTEGGTFYNYAPVTLTATASDPQDGDAGASIQWSSNLGGALGTGASVGVILVIGDHTITASVTNSNGLTASATRLIHIVAAPPTLTISAPADGATCYNNAPVTLTAAASDPLDGDLGTTIQWSSSLAGALGTGASLSVPLALGDHTITASVINTNGLTASASRLIHVVVPPPTPVVIQAIELQLVGPNQDLQVKVTVKDNNGVALPNITANCYMYLNGTLWHGQTRTTGADGTFTFVQVGAPAGTLTAKIVNASGVNVVWDGNSPVASITKVASIQIVIQSINLQLVGPNQDLQVKVTVKDSNGAALPNISVNCYTYLNGVIWHGQTKTTGADGTFTYVQANAPSGTFTVKAVTASGPDATWNGVSPVATIVKPVSTPVVIQAIELQLVGPNQDLQVKVTAQDNNGVALPGVTANCYMYLNGVIWHGQTKTTGVDGTFTFVQTGAPAGTFTAKIVNVTGVNMTWNGVTPVASITKIASITAVIQAIDVQLVGVNQDLQVKVTVK